MVILLLMKFLASQVLSTASLDSVKNNPDDTWDELGVNPDEALYLLQTHVRVDAGHRIRRNATKPTVSMGELKSRAMIHTKDDPSIATRVQAEEPLSGKRHTGALPQKHRLPPRRRSSAWKIATLVECAPPLIVLGILLPVLVSYVRRRSPEEIARAEGETLRRTNGHMQKLVIEKTEQVEHLKVHQKVSQNKADKIDEETILNEHNTMRPGPSSKEAASSADSQKPASLTLAFPGDI